MTRALAYRPTNLYLDEGKDCQRKRQTKHEDVRGMRNSTAAAEISLDAHRGPMSGYVRLKLNENACQCKIKIGLKVCAVNSIGMCILNRTTLQV